MGAHSRHDVGERWSTLRYGLAILVGAALLPRAAAIAYLLVAARAVFLTGTEGRLTLGHFTRH